MSGCVPRMVTLYTFLTVSNATIVCDPTHSVCFLPCRGQRVLLYTRGSVPRALLLSVGVAVEVGAAVLVDLAVVASVAAAIAALLLLLLLPLLPGTSMLLLLVLVFGLELELLPRSSSWLMPEMNTTFFATAAGTDDNDTPAPFATRMAVAPVPACWYDASFVPNMRSASLTVAVQRSADPATL